MISIFKEHIDATNDTNSKSKIEFIRRTGDSVSFARFWCDIKEIYLNNITNDNDDDYGQNGQNRRFLDPMKPIGILQNVSNEVNMKMNMKQELDNFNSDLIEDDQYAADFMRIFCHSTLGKKIGENDIIKHNEIINTLIQHSLWSTDICIVRGALIILTALIEKCNEYDIISTLIKRNGVKFMNSMINILNNQTELIQKYAIKLLSKLSTFSLKIDWNDICYHHDMTIKHELLNSYKKFESQWMFKKQNDKYYFNDFIDDTMFNQIGQSLFK